MKGFRLSTLMLLIVIAALGVALVVQQRQAARREAEHQAISAQSEAIKIKAEANFTLAEEALKRQEDGATQQPE